MCRVFKKGQYRHSEMAVYSQGLFVCLFVCLEFFVHSKHFHSFGDVNIAREGLQILTYARHSWPLSSEGSLACHTYCDTGHSFIMVIPEDPLHSHLMPSVWQWSCFNDLGLSRLGFGHPILRLRGDCCNPLRHRRCYGQGRKLLDHNFFSC